MSELFFSVLIPVFNGEKTIADTIKSILVQDFSNFELIIQDNNSSDRTREIVSNITDPRVKLFKNAENLGYSRNLREGKKNCSGDVLYLMGADDILLDGALRNTFDAFSEGMHIGAVTRPYYWFSNKLTEPIRQTIQCPTNGNFIVSINDGFDKTRYILDNEILGQLSGLAFRIKYMDHDFSLDPWISHGYPLVSIFKKYSVVFLNGNQLAVKVGENTTRTRSPLYDKSPTMRWVELYNEVMPEEKFKEIKTELIQSIHGVNYLGLIQIKNFGKFTSLIKECWYLIKIRPMNLLNLKYWFFSLGTIIVPSRILLPMVDLYKEKILSRSIPLHVK